MKSHTMRWMAGFAAMAMAITGCEGTASFSTGTVYGGGPSARSRWEDPGFFGARVNERMANIEQRVRDDIASGQLRAESINDLNARKAQLQSALSQASADGVIDRFEREQIRGIVRSAADIGMMQTGAYPANAEGYSGGYAPGSYYDANWDWGM